MTDNLAHREDPLPNVPKRSRAAFWILAILVVTTLANLVVGQMLPRSLRPVIPREDGSLSHLVNVGQTSVAQRYSFYFALGETGGSELIVFPGAEVNPELLDAFAGMQLTSARYGESDVSLPDLGEPQGKFRTDDLRIVDFWVVPGERGDVFWLAEHEGGYAAVADSAFPFPGDLP